MRASKAAFDSNSSCDTFVWQSNAKNATVDRCGQDSKGHEHTQ